MLLVVVNGIWSRQITVLKQNDQIRVKNISIFSRHVLLLLQIETDTVHWIPVLSGPIVCCGYTGTPSANSFSGESDHARYALLFSNGVAIHTTGYIS